MEKVMTPSPQQETVYSWVAEGSGNALVQAVAGSGKTTTLLRAVLGMEGEVAFLAYNKKIADEIKAKSAALTLSARLTVGTFHSFGFRAWRRLYPTVQVEDHKIDRLLEDLPADSLDSEVGVPLEYRPFVRKAYSLARQWGIGILPTFPFYIVPETLDGPMGTNDLSMAVWLDLVERYDLEDDLFKLQGLDRTEDLDFRQAHVQAAIRWTERVIRCGIEEAKSVIDFEDMIYCPLIKRLRLPQQDWVLVDECQDLNSTRLELARRLVRPGTGRAIFVGDRGQAIYGFTGADARSVDNIKEAFQCLELPLTVSFRCPQRVVKFAQQWCSHIEAAPTAVEGEVTVCDGTEIYSMNLTRQDAILCRNNAPLVALWFQLLNKGIPAHIEGRDIASGLLKLVNKWKQVYSVDQLSTRLETYREEEVERLTKRGNDSKAQTVSDMIDALQTIITNLPTGASLTDLREKVQGMFYDTEGNASPTLTLTSIHRSKGREWDRVFWWGRVKTCPSKYARQPWQLEQEKNLCYVAATRAKKVLVDVAIPLKTCSWEAQG